MIKIDNFTSQNSKNLVKEYNLILKEEESKIEFLKESFKNKFGFNLKKIILFLDNISLLRFQIADNDLFNSVFSKKHFEIHLSPIEDNQSSGDKIEFIIKENILAIKGDYFNNQLLNEQERKKISNSILNKIPEINLFLETFKELFVSVIKRESLNDLFTKKIYSLKNILLNKFKQEEESTKENFNNLLLKLKSKKEINLYFLNYNPNWNRNISLRIVKINYKKEGYFYNNLKISKNYLFLLYKNSIFINNKSSYELDEDEIMDLSNYLSNKKFMEELKLTKELENF